MSSEQELKCVFCSETFSQKEDLQIHFRKHADPNFNQKKLKWRSQDEADTSTEKPREQAEVVECDVCPEVFTSISKAITHKHKMHPDHDTKYFCPWCGKLFTMKHLYKKHINATHLDKVGSEEKLFHCDSCDVDFNLPGAVNYHNKFYHRQDDLPILGHSKKLKMILEELVLIYYCPFCGEEHNNKVNLHKHINEDHSSENQSPEDVFRCPLCDAIFYYLDAYELHLTYHSSEDLYTERNALMDEITDFSLETVQPLQEKVESAEQNNEGEAPAMGIQDLLEFTMSDATEKKSKKHKKHKKSKKSAITLDEFLNMNKDVFGEGIDFQGIEEVPTRAIAKRFKTKKPVTAAQLLSPDLVKLKKQGIVVKKQPMKIGKPLIKNNVHKVIGNSQKKLNSTPQSTTSALTSTDAVLTKLLNQGSQIKIVKKSNQDNGETIQQKNDDAEEEEEHPCTESNEQKNVEDNNGVTETEGEKISDPCKENTNTENSDNGNVNMTTPEVSPKPNSPTLLNDKKDPNTLENSDEDTNDSAKNNDIVKSPDRSQESIKLSDNVTTLQKNKNITLKLPKQNESTTEIDTFDNNDITDEETTNIKELTNQDNKDHKSASPASDNSSLNALKHLSHLITVKSVNSNKVVTKSLINKPENKSQSAEINKASPESQNNPSKKREINNFPNIKNLDGITIKPKNLSNVDSTKIKSSAESKNTFNDDNFSDEEWHDYQSEENKKDKEFAPTALNLQLNVQTKHLPKTAQKESPKEVINHDHNSQSSVDLLKHLKNVTAKPVNANSQKIATPHCSPSTVRKNIPSKTSVQKEITEDGTEIFSIDDSDSDEGHSAKTNQIIKTETNKSSIALKNRNIPATTNPKTEPLRNKNAEIVSNETPHDNESDWDEEYDEKASSEEPNPITSSPKHNQKNVAINNVLKNLSKNITVKSRNSSPSLSVRSQEHNSRDSQLNTHEDDSDSDSPLSKVKITEMDNMSDDELPEHADDLKQNVKIEHPDDSHSDHDDAPPDEDFDENADIEAQIAASRLQKDNIRHSSNLNSVKNLSRDLTVKSTNKANVNNRQDNTLTDEIPSFAKNLSNQISIKQIKKPENKNSEEAVARAVSTSSINQKMASNQMNTFNKEVKTVKKFQTQTKTVIQEITTTVTKTIKTVNQTTKQEVRNVAQSSSNSVVSQKIQGLNTNFGQRIYQGVKVRQTAPSIRPKIRGQAPQSVRAICPPPQLTRPALAGPVRANQLVPVRPAMVRPTGPRPRMPNAMNTRPSVSGQQRPQVPRTVKISPRAVFAPKRPVEPPGHFSCFKKPKESLIPEPDFANMKSDDDSATFSSSVQMSKSNFSSTSKIVKGKSVVTATATKSEMSASSQQLSRLRGMSGLVVKTSQSQAKQTQAEEKCEMNASKRNALEAIQKLQSQGLLVKKPRLDASEDSDHSQHDSDFAGHDSNEEFDE